MSDLERQRRGDADNGVRTQEGPRRVQQRRTKGWRKPENTVSVARPSKWGNPFVIRRIEPIEGLAYEVRTSGGHLLGLHETDRAARAHAVEVYGYLYSYVRGVSIDPDDAAAASVRRELAGKNLMCFCPLDQPCHADVLLEIANA